MSSVIGALRVNLGLDSAKFTRGMSQAQKDLATARKNFMAMSAVAVAAFGAVTAAALKGASAIDDNAKAARRLDSSVAGFRALEMAADDAGVSLSSLADNVQTMNREIAKNSQGAQDALRSLGLAASDLAGLDADQKLAMVADQVKALGLDSAQTSAVLQQLGIRNREMALLVLGGGDALRAARQDVQDFGLAISDVDAARIEAANDELAGLGDITRYVGDQLALKFVPALGAMAQAMTDSLREGGLLRKFIDGMIGALDGLAIAVSGVVVSLGVKYVTAIYAATGVTGIFTTALGVARAAVITLGGPLGIVWGLIGAAGAAWLVFRDNTDKAATEVYASSAAMRELNRLLGTFYETAAPSAGRAAIEYANNMREQAKAVRDAARAEIALQEAELARFQNADPMGREGGVLMGDAEERALQGNLAAMRGELAKAQAALDEAERAAKQAVTAVTGAMSEGMTDATDATKELAINVDLAMSGLSGVATAATSAGGAGRSAMNEIQQSIEAAAQASDDFGNNMAGHFDGLITGGKGLSGVLMSIARQLESQGWQQLFAGMVGGGGLGGIVSSIFGGFRADGGPVSMGKSYIVGERGPELFTPGASGQITSNENMGGGPVQVIVRVLPSGEFDARVESTARAVVSVETPKMIGGALARGRENRAFR